MSDQANELVITLDSKRIISLGLIAIVVVLSFTSYMVALSQFTSPSSEFRFQGDVSTIENINYADYSAISFSAGGTVRITGIVLYADEYWDDPNYYSFVGTISVKWIVIVLDPNNLPVHMSSGTLTGAGQSDQAIPEVSFVLPSASTTGSYDIRVMAWSDWLPSGDTLTIAVMEDTFTVGVT